MGDAKINRKRTFADYSITLPFSSGISEAQYEPKEPPPKIINTIQPNSIYSIPTVTFTYTGKKFKKAIVETDPHRLKQRQKQIEYGKNTLGYQCYLDTVKREYRKLGNPTTPDITEKISKRAFDGKVRAWRRRLHKYDPEVKLGQEYVKRNIFYTPVNHETVEIKAKKSKEEISDSNDLNKKSINKKTIFDSFENDNLL